MSIAYKNVLQDDRAQRYFERVCEYLTNDDARMLLLDRFDLVDIGLSDSHVDFVFATKDQELIDMLLNPDNWGGGIDYSRSLAGDLINIVPGHFSPRPGI